MPRVSASGNPVCWAVTFATRTRYGNVPVAPHQPALQVVWLASMSASGGPSEHEQHILDAVARERPRLALFVAAQQVRWLLYLPRLNLRRACQENPDRKTFTYDRFVKPLLEKWPQVRRGGPTDVFG